jgi:ABC-type transport system involved in multi-copper enzyme maturation permease subunit
MSRIIALAQVTVREAFRQKLAVNLLVFALALLCASVAISALTYGEQYRIIVNLGLSSMEVFGTLIAVFLGAGVIARDVERKTVYPILARPVSRAAYVAGRYLGLLATLALNLGVMAIVFSLVLAVYQGSLRFLVDPPFLAVLGMMVIQFAMVAAVSAFFSSFSTPTLSAILSLALVVAGHLASDLVRYWAHQGSIAAWAGQAAFLVVPNLDALDLKQAMVYHDPVAWGTATLAMAYGVLYSGGVVALATAVFSRRDLR